MSSAADNTYSPIRCTQNPTMGEEWRRGWHPEYLTGREGDDDVLIVGAGPTGLECAVTLGKRGYKVTLDPRHPGPQWSLAKKIKRDALAKT